MGLQIREETMKRIIFYKRQGKKSIYLKRQGMPCLYQTN